MSNSENSKLTTTHCIGQTFHKLVKTFRLQARKVDFKVL